jgi:hypothetical protein
MNLEKVSCALAHHRQGRQLTGRPICAVAFGLGWWLVSAPSLVQRALAVPRLLTVSSHLLAPSSGRAHLCRPTDCVYVWLSEASLTLAVRSTWVSQSHRRHARPLHPNLSLLAPFRWLYWVATAGIAPLRQEQSWELVVARSLKDGASLRRGTTMYICAGGATVTTRRVRARKVVWTRR